MHELKKLLDRNEVIEIRFVGYTIAVFNNVENIILTLNAAFNRSRIRFRYAAKNR
jgi:hypothetical protein